MAMVDCLLVLLFFEFICLIEDILLKLRICELQFSFQASPRLRFNKEGSLLALTTSDNGIKVLANTDGQRMLRMLESRAFDGSRALSEVNVKVVFLLIWAVMVSYYTRPLTNFACHIHTTICNGYL